MQSAVALSRLASVKARQEDVARTLARLRDQVCVRPRVKGADPRAYRYVVAERCVPTARAPKKAVAPDAPIPLAQTRKELAALEKALAVYPRGTVIENEAGADAKALNAAIVVFGIMIGAANRRRHPDPTERLAVIYRRGGYTPASVPPQLVYNMVFQHLAALLPKASASMRATSAYAAPRSAPVSRTKSASAVKRVAVSAPARA